MSNHTAVPPALIVPMGLDDELITMPGSLSEDELIDRLLDSAIATLRQITATVEEVNRKLASLEQRIECGEIRREVDTAMLQCLIKALGAKAFGGVSEWLLSSVMTRENGFRFSSDDEDCAQKLRVYERSLQKFAKAYRVLADAIEDDRARAVERKREHNPPSADR